MKKQIYFEQVQSSKHKQSRDHKILILGTFNSGKSTLFKQLCQIHGNGFKQLCQINGNSYEQLCQNHWTGAGSFKQNIYDFIIDQMKQLVEQCLENIQQQTHETCNKYHELLIEGYVRETYTQCNDNIIPNDLLHIILCYHPTYYLNGEASKAANYILSSKVPRGGIQITPAICNLIATLWNDQSIKMTFKCRQHLGIAESAPYFFEAIDRISCNDYIPTDKDMLLVRIPTTCVRSACFWVQKNKFTIVDVGGSSGERAKWIHQFDMVNATVFVCSLCDYDQDLFTSLSGNAMHESIRLFDVIATNRYLHKAPLITFFNKNDIFKEKIKRKSIKCCFPDFDGKDNDYESALQYIINIFTVCQRINDNVKNRFYSHVTSLTDSDNVQKVFYDVQHVVVVSSLQRTALF